MALLHLGMIMAKIMDISALVEKPEPSDAPSTIGVVGRYIIEPGVFNQSWRSGSRGKQ